MQLLPIGKSKLVITQHEYVPLIDSFVVDAKSFVLNTVCGPEILYIEGSVSPNHSSVFPRNVAVFNRKVRCFRASADDELVLGNGVPIVVVQEV